MVPPCKASRWFCCSILISEITFVIDQSWHEGPVPAFWASFLLALQWNWGQTNPTCLMQMWGNRASLLYFMGLLFSCPGWTAAVGSRATEIRTSIPHHVVSTTGPVIQMIFHWQIAFPWFPCLKSLSSRDFFCWKCLSFWKVRSDKK